MAEVTPPEGRTGAKIAGRMCLGVQEVDFEQGTSQELQELKCRMGLVVHACSFVITNRPIPWGNKTAEKEETTVGEATPPDLVIT